VDQETAMTELQAAVVDFKLQEERRRRLGDALLAATDAGVRQKDLVAETGYTREHIRRLVEAARKRRAEPEPRDS
jgi:hypothetical protein